MYRSILLLTVAWTAAASAPAVAADADTGRVSEIFLCNLNEGKDWDDWEEVNAFYAETVRDIGGAADDFDVFVWQPFRGNVDYDYVWAGYFDNLEALGASWQAYLDTEAGAAADARWEELETCDSALTTVETLHDSDEFPADGQGKAMIESFVCTLRPDRTMADVRTVLADWQRLVTRIGIAADVFMRTPLVSGSDIDVSYFAVHADAAAYGVNVSAYLADPDTADILARLDAVHDCRSSLWRGWQVFSRPD